MKVAKYALGNCIGEVQAPSQIRILHPFSTVNRVFGGTFLPNHLQQGPASLPLCCKQENIVNFLLAKVPACRHLPQIHTGVYSKVLQCALAMKYLPSVWKGHDAAIKRLMLTKAKVALHWMQEAELLMIDNRLLFMYCLLDLKKKKRKKKINYIHEYYCNTMMKSTFRQIRSMVLIITPLSYYNVSSICFLGKMNR